MQDFSHQQYLSTWPISALDLSFLRYKCFSTLRGLWWTGVSVRGMGWRDDQLFEKRCVRYGEFLIILMWMGWLNTREIDCGKVYYQAIDTFNWLLGQSSHNKCDLQKAKNPKGESQQIMKLIQETHGVALYILYSFKNYWTTNSSPYVPIFIPFSLVAI